MADFDWSPFESDRFKFEEVGDELVGTIVGLSTADGKRGPYPVVKVRTKGGEEKDVGASSHLAGELARLGPQVGDQIAMKLIELRHTGQPQPLKVFAVRHKPAEKPEVEVEPDYDPGEDPF